MQQFSHFVTTYLRYLALVALLCRVGALQTLATAPSSDATLVLKSPNKLFNLYVNNLLQTRNAVANIVVSKIPTPTCLIKIQLSGSIAIEQSLYLKPNVLYVYQIKNKDGRFWLEYEREQDNTKRVPIDLKSFPNIDFSIGQVDSTFYVPIPDAYWAGNKSPEKVTAVDSSKRRSGAKMIDENKLIKLFKPQRKYQECPKVMRETYQEVVKELLASRFDFKRVFIIKKALSAHDFSATEIIGLLEMLNFERNKIECAKFAYHFTTDYEKIITICNFFELERSINDFKSYLASFGP